MKKFKLPDHSFFNKTVVLNLIALSFAGAIWLPIESWFYDAFLEAFNMTNEQNAWLTSFQTLLNLICYIPAGIIADRYRPKKLLVWSQILSGIVTFWVSYNMNFQTELIAAVVWAITGNLMFGAVLQKAIRMVGGEENSGTAYSWYNGISSIIGFSVGLLITWVFDNSATNTEGMFGVYMWSGWFCIVSGIVCQLFFTEDRKEWDSIAPEDKMSLKDIPKILKHKYFIPVVLLLTVFSTMYQVTFYFTPYLTNIAGMSITHVALYSEVTGYFLFVLCPIGGYIADKVLHSVVKFYAVSLVPLIVILLLVAFTPMGAVTAIILTTIASIFECLMSAMMWPMLNEIRVPMKYYATTIGVTQVAMYFPELFVWQICGRWLDTLEGLTPYTYIFVSCAVACVFCLAVALFLIKGIKKTNWDALDDAHVDDNLESAN